VSSSTDLVLTAAGPVDGVLAPAPAELAAAFARFLRLDVAAGDASPDTLRTYRAQVGAWVSWCAENAVDPATAGPEDVKLYRQDLVADGYRPATIGTKLTILRRFYAAAQAAGLRHDNPAAGIRPPRQKKAAEDFGYLSEVELTLLFRSAPPLEQEAALRDRALLALFGLQGLRTVEIARANQDDLQHRADGWALLVRGKAHDRLVYLRPDVAEALTAYLDHRDPPGDDPDGTPLFTAVGNRAHGRRLTRAASASSPTATCTGPASSGKGCPTTPSATPPPPWPTATRTTCGRCRTCSATATRAPPPATPAWSTWPRPPPCSRCRSSCEPCRRSRIKG